MIVPVIAFPAIDPVALHLGPISIRWYGLAYVAAFIVAGFVMHWLVDRWKLNISDDDQLTIVIAAVIGVIVGGRLGYVLVYGGGFFLSNPARIFAIWDGGMSFHGGLAGILIAGVVVSRMMGIPWLTLCDLGSVGAPVGIFFGRIANFINGELWGRPTNVPWAMVFPNADALPRHPSQLYEALLEGLVLFLVMLWFATRRPNPPRGVILGWLLTLYGVFRIFVEFFRQPDIQMGAKGFLAFGVTTGQLLSVPMVIAGVWLIVWAGRRGLPELGRPEVASK
ncbi:MAG: prolipoprotein diacylglyceryl transferase [Coriobacteriia bacterium]|nr:prolipoprotein diacylglyceryl transferase [Coriobacteriia bacterium]